MKKNAPVEKSKKKKCSEFEMLNDYESRFVRLMEFLSALNGGGFTGYVKINYSQGAIARVEKFEEVLKSNKKSVITND
ncbi:MAG: hypothetical protein ABIL58_21230 [Pseudomonadota bacterium]